MAENTGDQSEFCLISTLFRSSEKRKEFWLKEGTNIVGRGQRCGIKLLTTVSSREHSIISVDGSYIKVQDLNSLNGTYINETRISPGELYTVVPQDIIGFGTAVNESNCDFPVVYQLMSRRKRNAHNTHDEVARKKRIVDVVELSSDDSNDDVIICDNPPEKLLPIRASKPSETDESNDGKSGIKGGKAADTSKKNQLSPQPKNPEVHSTVSEPHGEVLVARSEAKESLPEEALVNGVSHGGNSPQRAAEKPSPDQNTNRGSCFDFPNSTTILEKPKANSTPAHPLPSTCEKVTPSTSCFDTSSIEDVQSEDGDDDILLMSQLFEVNPPPTPRSLSVRSEEIPPVEEIVILDSPEYEDVEIVEEGEKQARETEENLEVKADNPALNLTQCVFELDPTNINSPKFVSESAKNVLSRDSLFEILSAKSQDGSPKPSSSAKPCEPIELSRIVETVKKRQKEYCESKGIKETSAKAVKPRRSSKSAQEPAKPASSHKPSKSIKPIPKKTSDHPSSAPTCSSAIRKSSSNAHVTFKRPLAASRRLQVPLNLTTISKDCPLVSEICQWHVMDFFSNKTTGEETNLSKTVSSIPDKFQNSKDYEAVYKPLLLQELWAELIRDAILQESQNKEILMFDGIVEELSDTANIRMFPPNFSNLTVTFKCFMIGDKKSLNELDPPRLGNVGIIMLKTANSMTLYPSFAVVTNHPVITDRPSKTPSCAMLKTHLPTNDGRDIVLNPGNFTPKPTIEASAKPYSGFPLNPLQREAVLGINETVWHSDKSINLIHGPPGTGKTSVICSLVLELLRSGRQDSSGMPKKILLCSPSNAAIDELVSKLIHIRGTLPSLDRFKLTRVGMTDHCESVVKQMTSESLAAKEVKRILSSSLQSKIDRLRAKEKYLANHKSSRSVASKLGAVQSCLKILGKCRNERLSSSSREFQKLVSEEEIEMISMAEIVATTLASSSTRKMFAAFEGDPAFCCAIVDEASQAVEPETLQPLYHSVRHLVLVGDPLQLPPTTLSTVVRDNGLSLSLFDRLFAAWETHPTAPLYKLIEQYRMHPEIVSFPSRQFYSNRLVTRFSREVSILKPYTLINHSFKEDDDGEMNQGEAEYVVDLAKLFLKCNELNKYTFGVIVPYRRQCRYVENQVRLLLQNTNHHKPIFVSTIDSYQGQERDIILFCCVRSERIGFLSDSHRLNVALTRARQCLVILGNFSSLTKDKIWNEMFTDASKRKVVVDAEKRKPVDVFNKLFTKNVSTSHRKV